jgi:hypothetical protein
MSCPAIQTVTCKVARHARLSLPLLTASAHLSSQPPILKELCKSHLRRPVPRCILLFYQLSSAYIANDGWPIGIRVQVQVSIGASALVCIGRPDACTCSQHARSNLFTFVKLMNSSTTFVVQREISDGTGIPPTPVLLISVATRAAKDQHVSVSLFTGPSAPHDTLRSGMRTMAAGNRTAEP